VADAIYHPWYNNVSKNTFPRMEKFINMIQETIYTIPQVAGQTSYTLNRNKWGKIRTKIVHNVSTVKLPE